MNRAIATLSIVAALALAGHAAADTPPPVKPVLTAPVKLAPGVKPTTPLVFQPSTEIVKLANLQLSAARG